MLSLFLRSFVCARAYVWVCVQMDYFNAYTEFDPIDEQIYTLETKGSDRIICDNTRLQRSSSSK